MTPEEIFRLRQDLPRAEPFNYYTDRESAWLLQALLPEDTPVRALRQGRLARLLDRPLVKPLTAAGDGIIRRADLQVLAHADGSFLYDSLSPATLTALERAFDLPWLDFELSFTVWGNNNWHWAQTSRPGVNVVLQLNFPGDHAALLERTVGLQDRGKFECSRHPVRRTGRPTLAWARLDIDHGAGVALIEEVQSDWLRFVRWELDDLRRLRPRSRALRDTQAYEAALTARYGKVWPRAMLLAALMLLRDRLGIAEIYYHQPGPGAVLKHCKPPVSLYSSLPKAFCFEPTRDVPPFLRPKRRKHLSRLPKDGPLFWKMAF
ncbi:hypothetical protein [Roseovarius sp.]|uniref:hypothetical protein n=1 Tax=Roseovarius sp. TaxID=1486281 RepID=UPI003BA923BD